MPMKLILRSDVENLGRLGDIVSVKPGYGRNYLVPQGLAMLASESNMKVFEQERSKLQTKMDEIRTAAMSESEKINAAELVIEVRVGEGDKLYGSVTTLMIGDALAAQGIDVDRRKFVLDQPIRALGDYEIPVKLHPDVETVLSLKVARKGGPIEEEEVPEEVTEEAVVTPEDVEEAVTGEADSGQESEQESAE